MSRFWLNKLLWILNFKFFFCFIVFINKHCKFENNPRGGIAYICSVSFEDGIFYVTMEIDNPREGNFGNGTFQT